MMHLSFVIHSFGFHNAACVAIQHCEVTVQIAADLSKIKAKKRSVLLVREHFSTHNLCKSVVS